LYLCHTLFPPPDIHTSPKGFSLRKRVKTFPFQFCIPILSACDDDKITITHLNATLPPSFSVTGPNKRAISEMKYWLKVTVERPGRFKSDIIEEQELKFMPLDPSLPPPMLEPKGRKNSRNILPETTSPGASLPRSASQHWDQHKVALEVTLPSPAIIHAKRSLPFQIFVFANETSAHSPPPAILRTLSVTLLTELTVIVGPNSITWTTHHPLLSLTELRIVIRGLIQPPGALCGGLWRDCIVPDLTPSFTTCTHMQQHFIVVTAGISRGHAGRIQASGCRQGTHS
jgi:hypothetical protein